MSYLEYINKLSELKQTIVGGSSIDNIETTVWFIGFLLAFAVGAVIILILLLVVVVIMTSLAERLFTWVASLFGKDMVFDFDKFIPRCMLATALCCSAIIIGTRSGGETNTKVETKMTSHEDSLVQLHNDLVNWNDSDFDELWNATVKYKLTKSDDDEYHEVVKVIKEVKQDRDKVKE